MSQSGILLIEQPAGWKLTGTSTNSPSTFIPHSNANEIAQAVVEFATSSLLDRRQVLLAVDSAAVLFARVAAKDVAAIKTNQALRYALEAVLPIEAESIVADSFPVRSDNKQAERFAVAMETEHVRALVDSLEQSQCKVQFIVPYSMLLIEQSVAQKQLPLPSISVWLPTDLNPECQAEVVLLDHHGTLQTWQMTEMQFEAIERSLSFLATETESYPVVVISDDPSPARPLLRQHANVSHLSLDRDELSRSRAASILNGKSTPWVDLRRDVLASHDRWRRHRQPLTRAIFSAVLLLLTICGALLWRAAQYQQLALQTEQKQQSLFRTAFPGQRVPAAILGRVRSEHAKATGLRRTDTAQIAPQSVMQFLPNVLSSLPRDMPFQLRELRVENGRMAMELELATQEDAGRVAAMLAQNGFAVDPPATTLIDGDRILASYTAIALKDNRSIAVRKEALR